MELARQADIRYPAIRLGYHNEPTLVNLAPRLHADIMNPPILLLSLPVQIKLSTLKTRQDNLSLVIVEMV